MARWNPQTVHTDVSEFSDNPRYQRKLKRKRRKLAAWGIALLAVSGISARYGYRAYREYRINRNLEVAQAAGREEDWGTARDKARSVLLARGQDFAAYRIWARALANLGAPTSYMAAAEIFTDPRATREDLLESLRVLAQQAPQAVALSAYASLPPPFRDQASFRAAITPLLIQRGEIELAEQCLREVAQPTDEPAVRLELLRVLCSRPDPGRVAEARRIFADLIAERADTEALDALRILGDVPGSLAPGDPLPDLTKWTDNLPKATARHHLLAMDPALGAEPEAADRLYAAAVKRYLTSDPGVLGTWLVSHGKTGMAVRLLEEPAKTRSDAYLARLQAMLSMPDTADLVAALAAPPASVDPVEMEIVQAKLALRNGDRVAAESAWTRALNAAAFDTSRNRCIEIARAAQADGAQEASENAWVAAIRLGWGQLPLYHDLLPVFTSLVAKGRSEDLLAMFQTLLRFEPRNPELLNNAVYFALIHGIRTPNEAATALTQLVESHPDKPVYASTLMLAEMLDGRPGDALTRLPDFQNSHSVTPMMLTALEGTARVLAGQTEEGTTLLKKVDWRDLMRQERVVFRNLLVNLKISGLPMPEAVSPNVEVSPEQIPAWRKAVERYEKDRAGDVLPALPAPRIPGAEPPAEP